MTASAPLPMLRRGQIVLVAFDPAVGSESAKTRPAVVVSNNVANAAASRAGRGAVTVVPVTSNVARVLPFQVLLPATTTGLAADSKAQAEQVRAVSATRVARPIGWVDAELMGELDEALRLHLAL
ncbi:type II toxin-antitoxin system PemK/MazF family toxin [Microbacterium sp.]|uniref:type II toxin-antitoxin system PemK/MazF family toxin n=1 Tax=Microbacterium sp. TaxID=51671 RepID=UPI0039E476B2